MKRSQYSWGIGALFGMLMLILDGKTNGEIADQLFISENTVKFHVKNILQKTGCRNRNDLVAAYISFFQA